MIQKYFLILSNLIEYFDYEDNWEINSTKNVPEYLTYIYT